MSVWVVFIRFLMIKQLSDIYLYVDESKHIYKRQYTATFLAYSFH